MLIAKLRCWLARRICRRYARDYLHDVDRMGLAWTLALIDEDVELHGHAFNHALMPWHGLASSNGQRTACSRRPATGSPTSTTATTTAPLPTPACTATRRVENNEHNARQPAVTR